MIITRENKRIVFEMFFKTLQITLIYILVICFVSLSEICIALEQVIESI